MVVVAPGGKHVYVATGFGVAAFVRGGAPPSIGGKRVRHRGRR